MNQPTLFSTPRVRATDPATSRAAAESLNPRAIETRCNALHRTIALAGPHGWTVAELVQFTGWDRGNTARRVTDLAQAGRIIDSGRTRPGPSGRHGIVWVAV